MSLSSLRRNPSAIGNVAGRSLKQGQQRTKPVHQPQTPTTFRENPCPRNHDGGASDGIDR